MRHGLRLKRRKKKRIWIKKLKSHSLKMEISLDGEKEKLHGK